MREKIYEALTKLYGFIMTAAFCGGIVPLVPFVIAIIAGGDFGESAAIWLYKRYYPVVIALASLAVLIGLAAMYAGKKEGLSAGNINTKQ